jgi:hypothetical protein
MFRGFTNWERFRGYFAQFGADFLGEMPRRTG